MPYTALKPGSKYWYAFYRDKNGRWRNKSTKLVNQRDAQKVAELLEATATGRYSAHHLKRTFAALYEEFYAEKLPASSVRQFGAIWLKSVKPELSESSYSSYQKTLEVFLSHLGPKADWDIIDIDRREILAFRNHLAKTLSPASTNRYLKIVRMIFKAAERDETITKNPAEFVPIIKDRDTDGPARRPFSLDEIRAVLAVANPEWQSLIKFGLYTGQRLGDMASLTWANIDLGQEEIRFNTRKTGRRMSVPIAAPLRDHLLSLGGLDSPKAPIHPKAYNLIVEQGRSNTLSKQFIDLLAQVGLREPVTHQRRGAGRSVARRASELSFHSLRHTAVSLLKAAGVPHATVQELVGHESAAVSQHYTHVDREALHKAAGRFPTL
jgi:integrase